MQINAGQPLFHSRGVRHWILMLLRVRWRGSCGGATKLTDLLRVLTSCGEVVATGDLGFASLAAV